jgi:hypothetical protein
LKLIVNEINKDRTDRRKWSPRYIGNQIKALGIPKKRSGKRGTWEVEVDPTQMEELFCQHGLHQRSERSVSKGGEHDMTERSEHTERSRNVSGDNFFT